MVTNNQSQESENILPEISQINQNRHREFDILKTVGILCIILAHTISKEQTFIYQLRNFDVPLMVIVSGSLFWLTSGQKNYSFWNYIKKRIPRLILPVWIFLLFFFFIAAPIAFIQGKIYPFTIKEIFYTFTLLIGGIGYVWIIRVFLLIAIVSPLILSFKNLLKNNGLFLLSLIPIYMIYEWLVIIRYKITSIPIKSLSDFFLQRIILNLAVDQIILLLIPYGCLFAVGIVMVQIPKKWLIGLMLAFLTIFSVLAVTYAESRGNFVLTQSYKYPPRLYYIAYSLFMSLALYLIADKLSNSQIVNKLKLTETIVFISASSLWIYLWHIFYLYYWKSLLNLFAINTKLIPAFFAVSLLSIFTVFIHKLLFSKLVAKLPEKSDASKILTLLFLK